MTDQAEITEAEFCERFKVRLLAIVGPTYEMVDDDGNDLEELGDTAEYAARTALSYWAEPDQRADGPEACAEADYENWE